MIYALAFSIEVFRHAVHGNQWRLDVGGIADANRKLAVRALHASLGQRAPCDLTQYAERLATWEVIPVIDGQEVIGAVIRQGPELHVGVTRTPGRSLRWLVHQVLAKTVAMHGHATTRVLKDNPAGLAFCRRLGFEVTSADNTQWHLICSTPTHARGGATTKGKET